MNDIGIVIVTFNSAASIESCLESALRTGAEVVLVDNASRDETLVKAARLPVRIITNSSNRGFAAAVNQGIACLTVQYVLLLNPDAVLLTDLKAMRRACDLPRAAGAGGRLLDESGRPQIGFMVRRFPSAGVLALEVLLLNRLWPNNPWNRQYRALDLDYSVAFEAEQPAGAFLMVRRDVWQTLGGFDENFHPLWFDDVDFCRRAADAGYRMYYVPEAVAKHTGGHSIAKISLEMRRFYWYGSFLRYAAKHFSRSRARVVCVAVILGSVLRMVVESVLDRSFKPLAAYSKVVRLAGSYFIAPARGGRAI
jgi:GT2 family glycosyltransferase